MFIENFQGMNQKNKKKLRVIHFVQTFWRQ